MSDTAGNTVSLLRNAIIDAMGRAMSAGELPLAPTPNFTIETPADRTNGDLASNVAMVSARAFKKAPRAIAEAITKYIELEGTNLDRFEIAGPGFINFFYGKQFYTSVIREIEEKGADYGKSDFGQGKRILVEFVSANPTGPMHIGNARGGALGDSLASVLSAAGYDVSREFYVNDAGNQIEKFATSLEIRYLQIYKDGIELPEDAYHGQDIIDHAKNFAEINGDKYVNAESSERRKALVDLLPLPLYRDPESSGASWPRTEPLQSGLQCFFLRYPVRSRGLARTDRILSHSGWRKKAFRWNLPPYLPHRKGYLRTCFPSEPRQTGTDCEQSALHSYQPAYALT